MKLLIRQEKENDYKNSEIVVKEAFRNAKYTDNTEHILVAKLRLSENFIPELSLVAEQDKKIIGHLMFTKLIIDDEGHNYNSLALAPVSVLPEYQNMGVGDKLIRKGLLIAKERGYKSVIVLGHKDYYPRFGFKPASRWEIRAPFEVEDEAFMALELVVGELNKIRGTVIYSKEFME